MKSILSRIKITSNKKGIILFIFIVFASLFAKMVFADWSGSFYNPGETLNPECLPSDPNCNVLSPLTSLGNAVLTTGAYANPAWITAIPYSILSGTVPIWNQDTTGNAGTVTNGVYTTDVGTVFLAPNGSGANLSGITSLQVGAPSGSGTSTGTNTGDNAANSLYSGLATSKQDALSGSGFVKINGTTIFYDNTAYQPAGSYQAPVTLTTNNSSGAATFLSNTLNIPNYTLAGLGGQPLNTNLTSIGAVANATGWLYNNGSGTFSYSSPTATTVGLNNVTNNAQVKGLASGTTSGHFVSFGADGYTVADSGYNAASFVTGTPWTGMGYLTSIFADSPLSGAGTSASHLTIQQANTSQSGYLSNTDWNTFNNKQPAGSYLTSLAGAWLLNGNTNGAKKTLGSIDNYDIGFLTNNQERMTILAGGNIGIGTTTPGSQLEIKSNNSYVIDTYSNQSRIAANSNASVSGQLQIASAACGSYTVQGSDGLTYGTVLGADGKCWLDRNLGATRVATAFNDYQAYGTLFQWGRGADGHQLVTYTNNSGGYSSISGTTSTLSTTDTPGHANFIMNGATPYDWRNPQNNNLWQGVSGVNNPCPSGFRLPTQPEWSTLVSAANITNYNTAYSSSLKLTAGGYRDNASGALSNQGGNGYYWSSSVNGILAYYLDFDSSSVLPANLNSRAYGFSVRCVKD